MRVDSLRLILHTGSLDPDEIHVPGIYVRRIYQVCWGLGFGSCGLGFGVWGLGFRVWGLGFVV